MIVLRTLIFILFLSSTAGAVLYKYTEENGVLHFSDEPLGERSVRIDMRSEIRSEISSSLNNDIERIVDIKSSQYNLDPSLIKAIIKVESNWNPSAVSPKGAKGLMQLMPGTSGLMSVNNPFDPEENIDGGIRYFKYLLKKFNGNIPVALAAYNAGPGKVKEYGKVPPYPETRIFVERILSIYKSGINYPMSNTGSLKIFRIVMPDDTILFTDSPVQ